MQIKKLIKIICFCSIFLILLNRIYTILSWKDTAGEYYSSLDSYYELEEDLVDVVFFGSSHSYCSVDPSVIWDEHGIASFNLAISGQDFAGSYYTMKEALKTQNPKVLCVDLFGATFSGYAIEGNLYRNTLPFKLSKNSYEMIDALVEDEERKPEFWVRWPIFHTRYKELQKEDYLPQSPTYLGYHGEFRTVPIGDLIPYDGEGIPMPEVSYEYMLKMIELAEEENVELCFFLAPYEMDIESKQMIQTAKEIAKEHDIPVLDMIELAEEIGLDTKNDFLDGAHTNHSGAEKISFYFGDFLAFTYDLEDNRGDERYAIWDDNSKVRNMEEKNRELLEPKTLEEYLDLVLDVEDYLVVIFTSGDHISDSADIYTALDKAGIGGEFYSTGGVWVLDGGESIYTSTEDNSTKYMDLGTNVLHLKREDGVNEVFVNQAKHERVMNGINIMVYDKVFEQVVDLLGFVAPDDYEMVH